MSTIVTALLEALTDEHLDQLADLLAPRMVRRLIPSGHDDRWLNSDQASEYLGCPRSRIHDLVQLGKLTPRRDGRRLAFKRADLDAYLEDPQ